MLVFPVIAIIVWALFYTDIFNWKEMLRTPEERQAQQQRAMLWHEWHVKGVHYMECVAHGQPCCNKCPLP